VGVSSYILSSHGDSENDYERVTKEEDEEINIIDISLRMRQQCKRQLCNAHLKLWGFSPFAAWKNGFSAPKECVIHSVAKHDPENPRSDNASKPLLCKTPSKQCK